VELIADLAGGLIDLEEGEDITGLKTRLLSSEEGRKRVVRIDNLKTLKLSWAALEKFISSKVISGHALYRGECQRPNTVTVFLTLNRGTFSKDMAQRVIEIRLRRPAYSAHWLDRVRGFLDRHRWDLIGEVLGALADEPARIETRSRWPAWEQGVLAQCPDFTAAVQDEIARRVEAMDDDDADALECEEFYRAKLLLWKHNPETQRVRIPTAINAEWLSEYAKRPYSASEATLALSIKPLTRLLYQRSRTARYWLWVPGPEVTSEPVDLGPRPAF
ncbi:MAG: hypothetical protein JOY80_02280, partial [Candidatus Dormibacteraeota bacterium]|nr:hypothetical protein [Candidatus Dormibacteraeota bacterium]